MVNQGSYSEYTRLALKDFAAYSDAQRYLLVNELASEKIEKVLDVGCGAGQQLLPFAEKKDSFCVGVDVAEEVGQVGQEVFRQSGVGGKGFFLQSLGEELPFADESFDAVICRVALPYMDNRRALREISRVMRPQGKFFLKIHAPAFYFGMIRERFKTFSVKQLAYPLICLTGGTLNAVTGKYPQGNFWKGKEVYQTRRLLERELTKNNLHIVKELSDTNPATPSFLIEKA